MVGWLLPYWPERQKVELLLRYRQKGFEHPTSMDQGEINAPFMGIEPATIGQAVVALAN